MIEIIQPQTSVDLQQLDIELAALSIAGYQGCAYRETNVIAIFDTDPGTSDTALVRTTIDNHTPSTDKHIKLYAYIDDNDGVDLFTPPFDVDYITGINTRLHPSFTDVYQGEIREITYYANVTQDVNTGAVTYTDPVLRENFTYVRDSVGFARNRTQVITYICEDGSDHSLTKTRFKVYDNYETIVEGNRRRGNLSNRMATELSGWLLATQTQHANPQDRLQMGRDFLRHHKDSFDLFVDVSDHQIVYDVRNDAEVAHAWLDETWDGTQTVREWIDDQINIWGLP